MKNITLNIPTMQTTHCQSRVSNAVNTMEGVKINALQAGKISVSLKDDNLEDEVIKTIEKAGYSVYGSAENASGGIPDNSNTCHDVCCTV